MRPVFNCLKIFRPTLTATTSFLSLEGFKTFIMTRNSTLTLPLLQKFKQKKLYEVTTVDGVQSFAIQTIALQEIC